MAHYYSFIVLAAVVSAAHAATTTPVAPGPKPAPLNITAILEKGGQFSTLLRLFRETQVGEQLQTQLNNSFDGFTLFAPTDNAFSKLKPGTLNSLSPQDQTQLMLGHILPRYYSLTSFETASNPLRTQASGQDGPYTVNVTSTSQQVNVSTGVDDSPINTALYSEFPLAVYSVESVLLPFDLFGVKPPTAAPEPAPAGKKKKGKPGAPVTSTAAEPSPSAGAEADSTPTTKASAAAAPAAGSFAGLVGAVGLAAVVSFFV